MSKGMLYGLGVGPGDPELLTVKAARVLRQAQDSPKKLTRRILKIAPERIHTMLPGIALLSAAAELYGSRSVVTSPYGVREGYLLSVLEHRGVRV